MRIAFFSDTFLPEINSISVSIQTLSQELASRGHSVAIFTTGFFDESNSDFKIPDLAKIYRFNDAPPYHRDTDTEIFYKDSREITAFKPDIIHAHTPFSIGRQGAKYAKSLNIPLIGSHHSLYSDYEHGIFQGRSAFSRMLSRRYAVQFYNKCALIIAPSRAIAENLSKSRLIPPISIIPNPINIKNLQPSAPKDELKKRLGLPNFSMVYFGRITKEKRIGELLKVFALLSSKYPQMRLTIIGDGPDKKNLEEFADKLHISNKVLFLGLLQGTAFVDAVASNDIFITASDIENQPIQLFEAMAIGLPQVVAKSPIDEYVEDGITGFITKKYSFIELSEKISKLINNPSLRHQLSENSKKSALKYDVSNIVVEYERIYKDFTKK